MSLAPTLLLLVVVSCLLFPRPILRLAGFVVGGYLRYRSSGRRERLLSAAVDASAAAARNRRRRLAEDADWEKVDAEGSAPNGGGAGEAWCGVVGFFHPFWSVLDGPENGLG
jgi:hypothetical protein